jgi:hypothetical protein
MKKYSLIKVTTLFLVVIVISASLLQCKKEDGFTGGLDRSFTGTADSTIYASFYESNTISKSDVTPNINDIIKFRSVQNIMHEYCATSNCHGGSIAPKLDTYTDVMKFVTPGNAGASKLWEYITTNNLKKAMPPISSDHEVTLSDKTLLYNWITNGAKERPNINDFRPAAVYLINTGCGSANCHNQATATGGWARKGLLGPLTKADTSTYLYISPGTGAGTSYTLLTNASLRNQVWTAYKDSVKKFYSDTALYASFRPYKTFTTPVSSLSTRGPLQTYDDILLDIMVPKSVRSNGSIQYTDPVTGKQYYAKGNALNASSAIVSRVDSTMLVANPFTGVYITAHQGDMAYGDGGLFPSEIALIKAWYFADPNIPAVWKYGINNAGIFKYSKSGTIIKQ